MTDGRINIHFAITQLCMALDLEPKMVREMTITPSTVTVSRYKPDANGNKHIVDDKIALEDPITFRVAT